jgi:hypothetical protein
MNPKIKDIFGKFVGVLLIAALFFHLIFVRTYLQWKIDSSLDLTRKYSKENNLALAKPKAEELIDSCHLYNRLNIIRTNYWNYGNAIHDGYSVLGLVAVSEGNIRLAVEHLLAAGNTPGSPQLDTYGPDMRLAEALLNKGERESVIQYLKECSRFWDIGKDELNSWSAAIKRGDKPDLNIRNKI